MTSINTEFHDVYISTNVLSCRYLYTKRIIEFDTTNLKSGPYTLLARSQDVAGNWGATASLTLLVRK